MIDILDRRRFLGLAALAGLSIGAGGTLVSCSKQGGSGNGSDNGPISIVALNPTSGTNAIFGDLLQKGQQIAIDEVGGKVNGRDLSINAQNTASSLDKALTIVRSNDTGAAPFFTGTWVSSNALAVGKELNRRGGIFTTTTGADELTGSGCQRSLFRWSVTTYGSVQNTIGPLLEKNPSLKRWYSISPNYIFGQALVKAEQDLIGKHGGTFVGNSYHALDETQFSGYVTNAIAAKPDVVVLNNYGTQAYSTIKAMESLGILKNVTVVIPYGEGVLDFQQLGPALSEGIYTGSQYFYQSDAPGNKYLVKRAKEKYNLVPTYPLCAGYISTRLIYLGIQKAGSTDPKKVAAALEGMTYDGPTGSETIRAADHQVIKNFYLLQGKGAADIKSEYDVAKLISTGNTTNSAEASGCTMPNFAS